MSEKQVNEKNEKSEEVRMRPDVPLAQAGRTALLEQLHKLRKNQDKAQDGDPDGVHDMRVATRRLRAGLKVMEETVFETEESQAFRRKLRALANALGATRDSDVFLEHLNNYVATLPGEKLVGLESLRELINAQHKEAQRQMRHELSRKKTARLLNKLETFLETPGAGLRAGPDDENEAVPVLVCHFSGSAIWRAYEKVLSYQTRLPAPIEVLHRLRVDCKRMRYVMEFFEEALPETAKSLIAQLTEAQDKLGALHDHQVALEQIEKLLKDQPDNEALHDYAEARKEEANQLYSDFEGLWQSLSGPDFRRCLASVLMGEEA